MYNVLHVLTGDDGGISAVVRNYYTYIDKEMIHFDLACITENEGNDITVMKEMGADIFHLPMKSLGIKEYMRALREILSSRKYDAIHVHESQTSYVALKVAKQQGIKCRIAHAHTSAPYTSFAGELRRLSGIVLNYHYATTVIGCGELAGNRVFGKWNMKRRKAAVLPNAIDLEKYKYDACIRETVRNELGVSDKFAVGLVGRLSSEKNHLYALRVIRKLHKMNPEAVLVLVGDGSERESIQEYIRENGMEEYVRLLGKRTDVNRLYQGFDCVILPSVHEGFPLVVVEALASGLPVVLSSNITKEFSHLKQVRYIDLCSEQEWIDSLHYLAQDKKITRAPESEMAAFDIKVTVNKLTQIYMS